MAIHLDRSRLVDDSRTFSSEEPTEVWDQTPALMLLLVLWKSWLSENRTTGLPETPSTTSRKARYSELFLRRIGTRRKCTQARHLRYLLEIATKLELLLNNSNSNQLRGLSWVRSVPETDHESAEAMLSF